MRKRMLGMLGCGLLLAGLLGVVGCREELARGASSSLELPASSAEVLGQVGEFSLRDQSGREVTRASLLGQPFVLGCFFSTCRGPCPALTENLRQLQQRLAGEALRFVSLSVDPATDTPEVLAAYAAEQGADLARWWFLTGDEGQIYSLIRTSFLLAVERSELDARDVGMQVTHDVRLVAVDAQGRIRGYYDGLKAESLAALEARLRFLASER